MSSINRIRIVNFVYSGGQMTVLDELFNFKDGEGALMNMANGGGKTSLIQFILQAISPRAQVQERPIEVYFKTQNNTAHIMVEWLQDNNRGYFLTGTCMKYNSSTRDVNYFNYLLEYDGDNPYDIKNMPVTEIDKEGYQEVIPIDKIEQKLRDASHNYRHGRFKVYSESSTSQYKKDMKTYGINQDEWKLVEKINKGEGSLVNIFENEKTSRKLIERWIIKSIEDAMQVESEKHVSELVENLNENIDKFMKYKRDKINIESYKIFKEKANVLLECVGNFASCEYNYDNIIDALFSFKKSLQLLSREYDSKAADLSNREASIKGKIEKERYQEASFRYRLLEEIFEELEGKVDEITKKIKKLETEEIAINEGLKIQMAASIYEGVLRLNNIINEIQQQLEVINKENEEVTTELKNVKYSLNTLYKGIGSRLDSDIKGKNSELTNIKLELSQNSSAIKDKNSKIKEQTEEKGQYKTVIQNYNKTEAKINKELIDAGYFDISTALKESNQAIQQFESNRTNIDREEEELKLKISVLDQEIESIREEKSHISERKNEVSRNINNYKKEFEVIVNEVSKYDISEKNIFQEDKNREKLQQFIGECNDQGRIYNEEAQVLKGKISAIVEERYAVPEDLERALNSINIDYELGSNLLYDEERLSREIREEYLKVNPLMPYAVIVPRNQLKKLSYIKLKNISEFSVPLIIKEDLLEGNPQEQAGYVVSATEKLHFIVSYDREMVIDKKKILALKEEMITRGLGLTEKAKIMESRATEAAITQNKLLEFYKKYNFTSLSDFKKNYEDLEKELGQVEELIKKTSIQREIEYKKLPKFNIRRNELNRRENATKTLIDKINVFLEVKSQYEEDYPKYLDAGNLIEYLEREVEELFEKEDIIKTKQVEILDEISSLKNQLTNLKDKAKDYISSNEGLIIEGDETYLITRMGALEGYLQNSDKEVQRRYLEEQLNTWTNERDGKVRELSKYEKFKNRYETEKYDEYYVVELEEKQERIGGFLGKLREDLLKKSNIRSEKKKEMELGLKKVEVYYPEAAEFVSLDEDVLSSITEKITSFSGILEAIMQEQKEIAIKKNRCTSFVSNIEGFITLGEIVSIKDFDKIEITDIEGIVNLEQHTKSLLEECKAHIGLYRSASFKVKEEAQNISSYFSESNLDTIVRFIIKVEDDKFLFNYSTLKSHVEVINKKIDESIELMKEATKGVEKDKGQIAGFLTQYVTKIYNELRVFDSRSIIQLETENGSTINQRMLELKLPQNIYPDGFDSKIRAYVDSCVEEVAQLKLTRDAYAIKQILKDRLSGKSLLDSVVNLDSIILRIYKVKQYQDNSGWVKWEDISQETSGGERFTGVFYMFMTIMAYIRSKNIVDSSYKKSFNSTKVLLMDNPFGTMSSPHLLKAVFRYADKFNTQLICFSDLQNNSIYDQFNLIYGLQTVKTDEGKGYLTKVMKKGSEDEEVEETQEQMRLETISFLDNKEA